MIDLPARFATPSALLLRLSAVALAVLSLVVA